MKGANTADFGFEFYKITHFHFLEPKIEQHNLSVEFHPSGIYTQKEGKFELTLVFIANYGDADEKLLTISAEATFKFNAPILFEEIPQYFYPNCIAILFPYLRAFISTLTTIAMVKPVILPILNLSSLTQTLQENSSVIKE